jgi:hypothetical protein
MIPSPGEEYEDPTLEDPSEPSNMGFINGLASPSIPSVSPSAASAVQRINEIRRNVYEQAIARGMRNLNSGTDQAAALFAMGSGLMSPTRGGTFGEALGQGMGSAAPFISRMGESQSREQSRIDALTLNALNQEAQNAIALGRQGQGRYHELLLAAGIQPGTPAAAAFISSLRNRGTNVNIRLPEGERAYEGQRGGAQGFGGVANQIANAGTSSSSLLGTLDALEESLTNAGPTGALTPFISMLASGLGSVGINIPGINDLPEIEQAKALTNKLVTEALGGSLGVGVSNADRQFLVDATANIGNSVDGNRLIIEGARRLAQRRIAAAEELRRLEAQHPRDFRSIEQGMAEWERRVGRALDQDYVRRVREMRANRGRPLPTGPGRVERGQWQGALPPGVPPGSTYRGTNPDGVTVFRTPDGRNVAVDRQ